MKRDGVRPDPIFDPIFERQFLLYSQVNLFSQKIFFLTLQSGKIGGNFSEEIAIISR